MPDCSDVESQQRDDELLKLLEKTKIERDAAIDRNKLLEDRLAAKDEIIRAKDGTIAVREEQLQLAKDALVVRTQVNTGDARVLSMCESQLAKAEARIFALENPSLLKRLFKPESLMGFGLGYGVGRMQPK